MKLAVVANISKENIIIINVVKGEKLLTSSFINKDTA